MSTHMSTHTTTITAAAREREHAGEPPTCPPPHLTHRSNMHDTHKTHLALDVEVRFDVYRRAQACAAAALPRVPGCRGAQPLGARPSHRWRRLGLWKRVTRSQRLVCVVSGPPSSLRSYYNKSVGAKLEPAVRGTLIRFLSMCRITINSTFQHARYRARKMLVGHRLVAIFRTAIWLPSGETGSSSLGDLFCKRYGDLTESVPVRSRTPFRTPAVYLLLLKISY